MIYDEQILETQYHQSLLKVLNFGIKKTDRTGTGTISIPHQYFYIKDVTINFPIIKAKKVFPKMALKELVWMMMGRTDVEWLQQNGVNYWNEWATKTDIVGRLTIGKSYGHQFRNFGGVDQLKESIRKMIEDTDSRRNIINLWNTSDLNDMSLPPCVMNYQFQCIPTELENTYYVDMNVLQRSADSFLGIPYDFMFVGWFLNIMCEIAINSGINIMPHKTFIPRDIHYTCNDYHIYLNHIEQVKQYSANFVENKNDIIFAKAQCFMEEKSNNITLGEYLKNISQNKFIHFGVNKFYDDVYDQIKAPIAI